MNVPEGRAQQAGHLPKRGLRANHKIIQSVQYPGEAPPQSLAKVACQLFPELFKSVSAAKRACRRGELLVQGAQGNTSWVVQPGDRIDWQQRVDGCVELDRSQAPFPLEVVYEDEHMACVVKPQGVSTHLQSEKGELLDLRGCLPYHLRSSSQPGMLRRPQHAHRLDLPTGGLLAVAKTRPALAALCTAFAERKVTKRYMAIVYGRLEGSGVITAPLEGQHAETQYESVRQDESSQFGWLTTVNLWPHTGRTHQLRKHMALLGHPLVGDPSLALADMTEEDSVDEDADMDELGMDDDSGASLAAIPGQTAGDQGAKSRQGNRSNLCLWAVQLSLPHPVSGEMIQIQIPEPPLFTTIRQ
ncbi:hypothetical protein WJX72_010054 [[Myrmecia] bisecta]|uniref:Pseudouridine synthase RsuA/RluA-like domain-containing protein n=1 Tax=[Myrmecia] bisecta TaxID=41462 RepID=A0AAW1QT00_9CHLO